MSLTIENERTLALVGALAELTSMSEADAVKDAVRRRLDQLHTGPTGRRRARPRFAPEEIERRIASMERSATAFRAVTTAKQRASMIHHGDWLYDGAGLPG